MLFAIMGTDVENSWPIRQTCRQEHLARIEILNEQGRLQIAGPFPDANQQGDTPAFTGSLIVADFESLEEAQQWAEADPYVTQGVFASVTVKPFKRVLP